MTDAEPGSERWNWLAEGNAKQARKRVSVDVLVRDSQGKILLVDPSYKDGWDMPGGMSEANEAPIDTAKRELAEELDLLPNIGRLLVVNWVSPHGPWDDLVALVFDGGDMTEHRYTVDSDEIDSVEFVAEAEAVERLPPHVAARLLGALEGLREGVTVYFQS